jgi:hypothetical protein
MLDRIRTALMTTKNHWARSPVMLTDAIDLPATEQIQIRYTDDGAAKKKIMIHLSPLKLTSFSMSQSLFCVENAYLDIFLSF